MPEKGQTKSRALAQTIFEASRSSVRKSTNKVNETQDEGSDATTGTSTGECHPQPINIISESPTLSTDFCHVHGDRTMHPKRQEGPRSINGELPPAVWYDLLRALHQPRHISMDFQSNSFNFCHARSRFSLICYVMYRMIGDLPELEKHWEYTSPLGHTGPENCELDKAEGKKKHKTKGCGDDGPGCGCEDCTRRERFVLSAVDFMLYETLRREWATGRSPMHLFMRKSRQRTFEANYGALPTDARFRASWDLKPPEWTEQYGDLQGFISPVGSAFQNLSKRHAPSMFNFGKGAISKEEPAFVCEMSDEHIDKVNAALKDCRKPLYMATEMRPVSYRGARDHDEKTDDGMYMRMLHTEGNSEMERRVIRCDRRTPRNVFIGELPNVKMPRCASYRLPKEYNYLEARTGDSPILRSRRCA